MSEIPEDVMKLAHEAYDAPVSEDASLNSLVSKDSRDFVLEVIARAILAERERCAQICRDMQTTTGIENVYANRIEAGWNPNLPDGGIKLPD